MALSLACEGADILITYFTKQAEAEAVVAEIKTLGRRAAALPLNVAEAAGFEAFFAQVRATLRNTFQAEHLHFFINNAGTGLYAPFAATLEAQLDEMYSIHLKAPFLLTQQALPLLADGGRIVNISTGLARFNAPGYAAYAAMKGGVEVLTRYQAAELGQRGITVNTVAPGAIETDFGGGVVRDNADVNAYVAADTALGRVGLPDDVGGVVAFLCSDEARWITGQRLEVSGGQHL